MPTLLALAARRAAGLRRGAATPTGWPDLADPRRSSRSACRSPVFYRRPRAADGVRRLAALVFPVGGYGDTVARPSPPPLPAGADAGAEPRRRSSCATCAPSIIEVLDAEFVDFARAKGLAARVVLFRHVLRNALISTVTLFGLHIGPLLGGAVITESVFAIPGVGRLMIDSIFARDYPVIQGADARPRGAGLAGLPASPTSSRRALDPRVAPMSAARSCRCAGARRRRRCRRRCIGASRSSLLALVILRASRPALVAPYDPARVRLSARCCSRRAWRTRSAPTISAATCSRASSPPPRIDLQIAIFAHRRPARLSAPSSALLVGYLRRLGRHRCSGGSSTLVSPSRSWCWSSPSSPCSARASSTCTSPSAWSAGCSMPG